MPMQVNLVKFSGLALISEPDLKAFSIYKLFSLLLGEQTHAL